jgi:hypothetical protein
MKTETDEKLGWSLSPAGNVVITMTVDDWQVWLFYLGFAIGSAQQDGDRITARKLVELANRVNAGNPHYRPYQVPAEVSHG